MSHDDFTDGKCSFCAAEGAVFADNMLCEECDTSTVHCVICDERCDYSNKCRHVFEDQYLIWSGAGVGYRPEANVRASFMDLLDAMPRSFAGDVKAAILSGKFYTWLVAPMIGGGGMLELHGIKYPSSYSYGDAILALGETGDATLADGYRWLVSLYKEDTPDANAITLRWIEDWRDQAAIARMADDGCVHAR
jgi:hypothetical protein